jgi:hypothetical protein
LSKKDLEKEKLENVVEQFVHCCMLSDFNEGHGSIQEPGDDVQSPFHSKMINLIFACFDKFDVIAKRGTRNPEKFDALYGMLAAVENCLSSPVVGPLCTKETSVQSFLLNLFKSFEGRGSDLANSQELDVIISCWVFLARFQTGLKSGHPECIIEITTTTTKKEWKILLDTLKIQVQYRMIRPAIICVEIVNLLQGIMVSQADKCMPAMVECGFIDASVLAIRHQNVSISNLGISLLFHFINNGSRTSPYHKDILSVKGILDDLVDLVVSFDKSLFTKPKTARGEETIQDVIQSLWILIEYDFLKVAPTLKDIRAKESLLPLLKCRNVEFKAFAERALLKLESYLDPTLMLQIKCALPGCMARGKFMKCGRCKMTYYCSVEHQRDHWKVHKLQCNPDTRTERLMVKNDTRWIHSFNLGYFNVCYLSMMNEAAKDNIDLGSHVWFTDWAVTFGRPKQRWISREELLKMDLVPLDMLDQKFRLRAGTSVVYCMYDLNGSVEIYVSAPI